MSTKEANPIIFTAVKLLRKGHENARPIRELSRELTLTERVIREMLEGARAQGVLVCNEQDGKGYYLAETLDDIERQYRRDYRRAMSLLVRLKPMRKILRQAGRLHRASAKQNCPAGAKTKS